MIETVKIEGKNYKASYKGVTARVYRERFHSDLVLDLAKVQTEVAKKIEKLFEKEEKINEQDVITAILESAGEEQLSRFAWVCIQGEFELKNQKGIDYQFFVDNINDYPKFIGNCIGIYQMMTFAVEPTEKEIKSKKKPIQNQKRHTHN